MNWLEILIVSLFIGGIILVSLIFYLRKDQIFKISKSIFNDFKIKFISSSVFILFFSITIAVILTGFSANDEFINVANNSIFNDGYENYFLAASDITTYDQDSDYSADSKYKLIGDDYLSDSTSRNINNQAAWCQALVEDNIDYLNPNPNGGYYTVEEIMGSDYPLYSESNYMYQIGYGDNSLSYDNSYLYCLDYKLASMSNKSDPSKSEFNYNLSYAFTTLINLSTNIDGKRYNIQITTIPEKSKYNSFTLFNGKEIDQSSITIDQDTDGYSLDNNEIYLVDYNLNDDIKNISSIDVALPYSTLPTTSGDVVTTNTLYSINDMNKEFSLSLEGIGTSSKYMYPLDRTSSFSAIGGIKGNEKDTNNIYGFVTEDTMENIFKYLLVESSSNKIPEEIFLFQPGDNFNSSNRNNQVVDYRFSILNENLFNTIEYLDIDFLTYYGTTNDYYDVGIIDGKNWPNIPTQNYKYGGDGRVVLVDDSEKFDHYTFNDNLAIKINSGDFNPSNIIGNKKSQTFSNLSGITNYYASNSYVLYIFLFVFILLGVIISIVIISKIFNDNIKQIGVLKAMGYSQSAISFGIAFKIFLILSISFVGIFIFYPAIISIWNSFFLTATAISIPLYSISGSSIIFGILLPIGAFWIFSIVLLRLYYLRMNTMNLIGNKPENKPNIFIRSNFYTNWNGNFNLKLSANWGTRNISKSMLLLFSSISISTFTLMSVSSKNLLNDSINYFLDEQFDFKVISPYNLSPDSGNSSNELAFSTIDINEFENSVNQGTIKPYTFNYNEASKLNWDNLSYDQFIAQFNSYIGNYISNEPLSSSNKRYIPNNIYEWLINDVFSNQPSLSQSDSVTWEDEKLYVSLKDYLSGINYKNDTEYGITLGFQIYDPNSLINLQWNARTAFYDVKDDDEFYHTTLMISPNNLQKFSPLINESAYYKPYFYNNPGGFENIVNDWNDEIGTLPDGKVPFYTDINVNFQTVAEPGDEFKVYVPIDFMYDTNSNGKIDNVKTFDGEQMVELNPTFIYKGNIAATIPFLGVFLPINDPDLIYNTNKPYDLNDDYKKTNDQMREIVEGKTNLKSLTSAVGFKFKDSQSTRPPFPDLPSLVDIPEWISEEFLPWIKDVIENIGINSEKYYDVESWASNNIILGANVEKFNFSTSTSFYSLNYFNDSRMNVSSYWYNNITEKDELPTFEDYLNINATSANLNALSGESYSQSAVDFWNREVNISANDNTNSQTQTDDFIDKNGLPFQSFSLTIPDENDPLKYYCDAKYSTVVESRTCENNNELENDKNSDDSTTKQSYYKIVENYMSDWSISYKSLSYKELTEGDPINQNYTQLQQGGGLTYSTIFYNLTEPVFKSTQDAVIIYSSITILLIVVLLFIVINDILQSNKKQINILKVNGKQTGKIILTSYSSYIFIFALGFAISVPIMYTFTSAINAAIPLALGTISVHMTISNAYLVWPIIALVGSYLISLMMSYVIIRNSKPLKLLSK